MINTCLYSYEYYSAPDTLCEHDFDFIVHHCPSEFDTSRPSLVVAASQVHILRQDSLKPGTGLSDHTGSRAGSQGGSVTGQEVGSAPAGLLEWTVS